VAVEKLCAVFKFVFTEKKLFNSAQVALTKMPRNEGKIYQEMDFLSTKGHLLTSPGCFLTCSFAKVEWFTLSSSKLRPGRFLGRSADRTLKLAFANVILSCRFDFSSVNSSLIYVFLLANFLPDTLRDS